MGRTLQFSAPEVVLNDSLLISFSVDVFALGCAFAEMLTEMPLFIETSDDCLHLAHVQRLTSDSFLPCHKAYRKFFTRRGMLFESAQRRAAMLPPWEDFCGLRKTDIDFIKRCCRIMPCNRPSLEECTAWFQEREAVTTTL